MSKSLGNAIGIHEAPLEMYGKVMSISDEMMWRYYELLTDVRVYAIEQMKADAASGKAHPMALKKELARSIVADFHSVEAAAKAAEDWAKQFQKDQVPENVEEVHVDIRKIEVSRDQTNRVLIRLDKLLTECGLADSTTDANRKIKQRSLKVENQLTTEPRFVLTQPPVGGYWKLSLRVGKRLKTAVIQFS
jgi:tyrosyl-tRNA synthetase